MLFCKIKAAAGEGISEELGHKYLEVENGTQAGSWLCRFKLIAYNEALSVSIEKGAAIRTVGDRDATIGFRPTGQLNAVHKMPIDSFNFALERWETMATVGRENEMAVRNFNIRSIVKNKNNNQNN